MQNPSGRIAPQSPNPLLECMRLYLLFCEQSVSLFLQSGRQTVDFPNRKSLTFENKIVAAPFKFEYKIYPFKSKQKKYIPLDLNTENIHLDFNTKHILLNLNTKISLKI